MTTDPADAASQAAAEAATDPADGTAPGHHMRAEIHAQPAMLARLLGDTHRADDLGRHLERTRPRFVLFAARGTSDHAALYGKYLAEIQLALPAGLISPSTTTLYGARPELGGALFVAVSQSGTSPDLVDALAAARRGGATTVAVTNAPGSALAEAAQFSLHIGAGVEHAVAATKTYTAELLALYLLISSIAGRRDTNGLAALPEAAERTLRESPQLDELARHTRPATHLIVAGRGYSYPTAREAALKLMETCYLPAHAYSGADLLHGPLAMISTGTPVIVVRTQGKNGDAMRPVLDKLAETGADVLSVGLPDGVPVFTDGIREELHPLLQILPLQQLAHRLALLHGNDPDHPRGLAKVTRTR